MRIRRRLQGQSLSPLLPSDPPAPQPPPDATPRDHHLELLAGDKKEELHPNAATAMDLGDEAARRAAPLPLLPQDNMVEGSSGLGAQRGPAAEDDHKRLENGDYHMPNEIVIKAGESLANGISPAMPVIAVIAGVQKKEDIIKDDGGGSASGGGSIKKRCDPPVPQEGSRCNRNNGRGWHCCQPTMVGYSICQHHLGNSRSQSVAAAAARATAKKLGRVAGGQKLGRTEHKKSVPAVVVATVNPPPNADVSPPPRMPAVTVATVIPPTKADMLQPPLSVPHC